MKYEIKSKQQNQRENHSKLSQTNCKCFLHIPPKQIGYSMFFQGKFHPSKTKKARLCRGFACPHHPDSLAAWDHDMVAAPLKKSWLPQGGGQRMVQRCPLCWAENFQFFIWDTLSLGVPSFFLEFPCTIIEFLSPNSARKAPTTGTIEQPGRSVPNCWSFS